MKKTVLLLALTAIYALPALAQDELFRVATVNCDSIRIGSHRLICGDTVRLDDTISFPTGQSALKLYGTRHKRLCLVGAQMHALRASTIAHFLAASEQERPARPSQRHTTVRDIPEPLFDTTNLYLLDTTDYFLQPILQSMDGLELHIESANGKEIVARPVTRGMEGQTIMLVRHELALAPGDYEVTLWHTDRANDINVIVVYGLTLTVLPSHP